MAAEPIDGTFQTIVREADETVLGGTRVDSQATGECMTSEM